MEKLLSEIFKILIAYYKVFSHNKVIQEYSDFPYVTFNIASGVPNYANYQLDDFILNIDIWDRDTSETVSLIPIETMTDTIVTLLDRKKIYIKDELQACFYLTNRVPLGDPRPEINRRQLTFQVRAYLLSIKKEEIL